MSRPVQIFDYKSDDERVRACHEREKCQTWMKDHISDIIGVHQKIRYRGGLTTKDLNLMDIVFNNVITDILHADAEQRYLMKQLRREGGIQDERKPSE